MITAYDQEYEGDDIMVSIQYEEEEFENCKKSAIESVRSAYYKISDILLYSDNPEIEKIAEKTLDIVNELRNLHH